MDIAKSFLTLFVILGFIALIIFISPFVVQEAMYLLSQFNPKNYQMVENFPMEPEKVVKEYQQLDLPNLVTPKSWQFSLVIPKLDINSLVSKNISLIDKDSYFPAIYKGIAHAKGSGLPIDNRPMFLFAHPFEGRMDLILHNIKYFLLNKMDVNDVIYVFYNQQRYDYMVTDVKILSKFEAEDEYRDLQGHALVLQAYYPIATHAKRILVFAQKVDRPI
jgi:LPXTG-site transpeptidase (sortase) family protein